MCDGHVRRACATGDGKATMQIAIHLGAHCTDEDRLVRTLLRNAGRLAEEGIVVPGPARYRKLMREAMKASDGIALRPDAEEALLDAILDRDHPDRLVLSYENFMCVPPRVLGEGMFYPMAEARARAYRAMFPAHGCEFFLAVRNPATFLPALHAKAGGGEYAAFLNGCEPDMLLWSETVIALREGAPDAAITVWCDEDTPLIWPEVLREVSGHDPFTALRGTFAILSEIMTEEGLVRLRGYLAENPPPNEIQRRRVVAAFLSKYARPEVVEVELDLPGWTDETVEKLTEIYDEDVLTISRLPGVHFIAP